MLRQCVQAGLGMFHVLQQFDLLVMQDAKYNRRTHCDLHEDATQCLLGTCSVPYKWLELTIMELVLSVLFNS